jgi:hypothetical protein
VQKLKLKIQLVDHYVLISSINSQLIRYENVKKK